MIENLKKHTVNVQFLAEVFGVTDRTIQNYVLKGLPRDERGEYPFIDCLLWMLEQQKKDIEDLQKENPLSVARKEAIELNNQKKRLDLEKQQASLLDAETVELVNISFIKMIVRNLKSIGPRLNKKINGDAKTLSIINQEIEDMQNLCANTPLNYFEDDIEQQLKEENN